MRIVTRHRTQDPEDFLASARHALDLLAARPGFVSGEIGRSPDDEAVWLLTSLWADAGSMRRGLSGLEIRAALAPLMVTTMDETATFEVLAAATPEGVQEHASDLSGEPPTR